MKFYVDENIHSAIVSALQKRGFDTKYAAHDASGLKDRNHLEKAGQQNRIIITADDDFLKLDQKFKHAGIIFLTDQEISVGTAIKKIGQISAKIDQNQFENHIEFI